MTLAQARLAGWMRMSQLAWTVLRLGTPLYALVERHWLYGSLLALAVVPPKYMRGYIVVSHLLDVAAVVVGVALGFWNLAVFGVVVPEVLMMTMLAVVGPRFGLPRFRRLIRNDWPPRSREQKRHEMRQRVMFRWSEQIRRASRDRSAIERVLLEMRWWWMTPEQATALACSAGAKPEIVQQLVDDVISWPNRDEPKHVRASEAWSEEIGLEPTSL